MPDIDGDGIDDVEIINSWLFGSQYGVEITQSNDVVVRDTTVISDLAASESGVYFNYENDFFPLSNVFVETTTAVSGFNSEAYWSGSGTGLNDGDSVAYCKDEASPPLGCDNWAP